MAVHRNARADSRHRSQSAMEYLMTYGWAILIVAVVLAALFQLGVFSGVTSPRAQPGTCRVVRPMGAGTSAYASLQGVCTGLLPQFVAQFDGSSSVVTLTGFATDYLETSTSPRTLSLWVYLTGFPPNTVDNNFIAFRPQGAAGIGFRFAYSARDGGIVATNEGLYTGGALYSTALPLNTWINLAYTFNPTSIQAYVNGNSVATGTLSSVITSSGNYYLFKPVYSSGYPIPAYKGANVQIYNKSLDANEILAIYKGGIGGAPIQVQNLIGWWPLNGNANDTSGNLHNGVPTAVTYTSSWTSGYSLR